MSTAPPAEFHPYDPAFAADPYPVYARLREQSPICQSAEIGATLVTRFDNVRSLVVDGRVGRTMDARRFSVQS
jgi:cytochrome P450